MNANAGAATSPYVCKPLDFKALYADVVQMIKLSFALVSCLLTALTLAQEPVSLGKKQPFRGKLHVDGMIGYQIGAHPMVGYATSLTIDEKGRLFLVESDRLGRGILDIRGASSLTVRDFQLQTVAERREQYLADETYSEAFFISESERLARLEDVNGDGIPDKRTEFAAGMNDVVDGLAFSALAMDGSVYLTCIPNLWRFDDTDDDGIADQREVLLSGFGVRTSMMGHDMHGIIMGPDGRLYWTVGDRGYNVVSKEGERFAEPGRGAVFRSDPDGSNFEVIHHGLRNPQELAFDHHGNLFTFDNTGDIGDEARVVYVLEGADSGWHEEHQAAHQYRTRLDFTDIALPVSLWVAEKMYAPRWEDQPKWILPPVANAAHGPSGVVYLTGDSIPNTLQNTFLLCNYRGASSQSELLALSLTNNGAGFQLDQVERVLSGVGASDVAHGYDGKLYVLDFGGGWGRNENGSLQVMEAPERLQAASVQQARERFARGFDPLDNQALMECLSHVDMRVRQRAQFTLVRRNEASALLDILKSDATTTTRLHALWGIGQLARTAPKWIDILLESTRDPDGEIRANACRTLGDLRVGHAREALLACLQDDSLRVRSLAAIALGKCGQRADAPALWKVIDQNAGNDVVLRQAAIIALARLKDAEGALGQIGTDDEEMRLCAALVLRRLEDVRIATFLTDPAQAVREEAIRAIYDLHLTEALPSLAKLSDSAGDYQDTLQRRFLFAHYWEGTAANAAQVIRMAMDDAVDEEVRETALKAVLRWNTPPTMDPVTAFYRPTDGRAISLLPQVEQPLRELIDKAKGDSLALAFELANQLKMPLPVNLLEVQALNEQLEAKIRIAALNTIADQAPDTIPNVLEKLDDTEDDDVYTAGFELRFKLGLPGRVKLAVACLETRTVPLVRAALKHLATDPEGKQHVLTAFQNREKALIKEAHLDAYLALQASGDAKLMEAASTFAATPSQVHQLTLHGGNRSAGEQVFQNQGACTQCHAVTGHGGGQGPPLDDVGNRLSPEQLLESLVNPSATIAEGYGLFTVTTTSGEAHAGRLGKETETSIELILPTEETVTIPTEDIATRSGPISAMPPMALTLPPTDLRDLIRYLESLRPRFRGRRR